MQKLRKTFEQNKPKENIKKNGVLKLLFDFREIERNREMEKY